MSVRAYCRPRKQAAPQAQIEIVQRLLDAGADPTVEETFGNSPLSIAADDRNKQMLKLLKEYA